MGKPNLYPLHMEFEVNGEVSDQSDTEFGIREVTSEFNSAGGRAFSHQRQEDPDSRRRLDAGHDAAGKLRSACRTNSATSAIWG